MSETNLSLSQSTPHTAPPRAPFRYLCAICIGCHCRWILMHDGGWRIHDRLRSSWRRHESRLEGSEEALCLWVSTGGMSRTLLSERRLLSNYLLQLLLRLRYRRQGYAILRRLVWRLVWRRIATRIALIDRDRRRRLPRRNVVCYRRGKARLLLLAVRISRCW